jgi:hypothetical protein
MLRNPYWLIPLGCVALPAIVVVGILATLPPTLKPKFHVGTMVETVVGHHRGQVVWAKCSESMCFYDVRFDGLEVRTDTKLMSRDRPVKFAPLSKVNGMREFELREAR